MNRILKISAWTAGAIVLGACTLVAGLLINSDRKLARTVELTVKPVPYATGEAAEKRGRYLFLSRCGECHGEDGTGRVFINEPAGLVLAGANLTRGRGSAVLHYTEADWVRTIRHGVAGGGRPMLAMPSLDFNRLSDTDLADIVAYVRALPPKNAPSATVQLPLVIRLAYGAGVIKDAYQQIDHSLPPAPAVQRAVTPEYGHYVAQLCVGCHGKEFRGGPITNGPPDWPPAAQLAGRGSVLARYDNVEQFKTMLRTRTRPDGSTANAAMPTTSEIDDADLEAIYLYFKSTLDQPAGATKEH